MKKLAWILFLSGLLLPLAGCTINPRLLSSVDPGDPSSTPGKTSVPSGGASSQTNVSNDEGFVPHNHGGIITYGFYPQTIVDDDELIYALDRLDGSHYLPNDAVEYEGNYYFRQTATPYSEGLDFSNHQQIYFGRTYWFICEPIRWIILSEEEEGYLCLSENVLEQHFFGNFYDGRRDGHYANAWQDSALRDFLNDKFFFYSCLYSDPDSYVLQVINDNSPATTDDPSYEQNGADTYDIGFALCYLDFCDYRYGFSNVDPFKRHAPATDYARARGVRYSSNAGGCYWTRSPSLGGYKEVWAIDESGSFQSNFIESGDIGVRPAIFIAK